MIAPDLSGLIPREWYVTFGEMQPMQARWVAWLAITQLSLSAMCFFAIRAKITHAVQVSLAGCAIWFALQGLDEILAGNFFHTLWVEYPLLLAGIISTHIYLKYRDPSHKQRRA